MKLIRFVDNDLEVEIDGKTHFILEVMSILHMSRLAWDRIKEGYYEATLSKIMTIEEFTELEPEFTKSPEGDKYSHACEGFVYARLNSVGGSYLTLKVVSEGDYWTKYKAVI